MPRALSMRSRNRIRDRIAAAPDDLGAQLAAAMLKYCIPANAVAELVEVTPESIYRWMYHGGCHNSTIKTFVRTIERIANAHPELFPLQGTVDDRTLTLLCVFAEHA